MPATAPTVYIVLIPLLSNSRLIRLFSILGSPCPSLFYLTRFETGGFRLRQQYFPFGHTL